MEEKRFRNPLSISLIQTSLAWADKQANLSKFSDLMLPLAGKTDLIVLPEMFATGFITTPVSVAEPMNSGVMNWMKEQAAGLGSVITGSIAITENGRYYNRLVWMRPDGSFETTDKRHLFRMGNEHEHFEAGKENLVVVLNGWKIRPLVCYDLRFPVWSKNRYSDGEYDYDLLIYVANWPASRSAVWKSLLCARAIENLAYCAGVNRIGEDGHGLPHSGDSRLFDFKGHVIWEAPPGEELVRTFSLEADPLHDFRNRFAVGMDWDRFEITG